MFDKLILLKWKLIVSFPNTKITFLRVFVVQSRQDNFFSYLEIVFLSQVGGAVREVSGYTATYRHTITVEEGGEEGDCLHMRQGYYHTIDGFPNCVVTDAVVNFFMASTEKVRQASFDPHLSRRGHLGESL